MSKVIQRNLKKKLYIIYSIISIVVLPVLLLSSASADTTVTYEVQVEPSLNISFSSDNVSLDLNPLNKTFDTQDLLVTVSTNNPNGYKLYVNTDNDTTNLINTDYSDAYIETLGSTVTESAFDTNKWGFRITGDPEDSSITGDTSITSTTSFFPFASGSLISSSSTATNASSATLTFASKINYQKPSGTYSLDLNFKALPVITTYTMQDIPSDICTADPTIVTDARDGSSYTIARLADNNCWMLDNLRLDLTDERVQSKLSSTNTNATDEILDYLINGGGSSPYPAMGVSKDWTSSSQNVYNIPYIAVSGVNDNGSSWDRDDIVSVKYGEGAGKIGVYYNYCAASAGSYCYAKNSGVGGAEYDVCPAGWRMPTGGENGEYRTLCADYKGSGCSTQDEDASALLTRDALSASLTGLFQDGVADRQNIIAGYWSSTEYGNNNMYTFVVTSEYIIPANQNARYRGFSVRCLLK